jgi:vacuolar protein sorting-associated protein IST1
MGLIGKSFTSKLKNMTSLAISRIAILKNHRKARASYAFSDVSQLLNLGYHDQALVRVSTPIFLFLFTSFSFVSC